MLSRDISSEGIDDESLKPVKPWMQQPAPTQGYGQASSLPSFNTYGATHGDFNRIVYHPAWNALQGIQEGSHQLTSTLSTSMAAVSNFIQLVDTTVFSAWSSLTSLLALLSHISSFHQQYVRGGLETVKAVLGRIIRSLFGYASVEATDTKRIATIILGAAIALAFLTKKALAEITALERSRLPEHCVAVVSNYTFTPSNPKQLPLQPGQRINISVEDVNSVGTLMWPKGWSVNGNQGYFPANYVSLE